MNATRAVAAVALSLSLTAVAAAQNVDTAHRLCATAGNAQPPVYLTMTSSGLARLELSPSVPDGIAQIAVSREEIATLCAEGLDVRYREPGLLPAAFSIVRRRGAVYGNLWSTATTPDGATAQWLMFDVRSAAYEGQGEHAPIALFLDARRLTATPPAIVGNGMVFGEVQLALNGCGGPSSPDAGIFNTEVEAFWSSGNHLWSSTCGGPTLSDETTYSVVLRATADGWVAFANASGGTGIAAPPAVYTPAQRPPLTPTNGGVLMASTNFCPACSEFSLYFSNVDTGWSIDTADDALPDSPNPLSASADAVTFPATTIASRGVPQQVTFTNNSSSAWDVQFDVKASNAPHCGGIVQTPLCAQEIDQEQRSFIVSDSACHPIYPLGQCTVSIAFEPQGPFKLEASLEYHVGNAYAVAVSFEGIGLPQPTLPGTVLAVEYFNPALGHYFITTLPIETAVLDSGSIAGWIRTGQWFWAYPASGNASGGRSPVCRFYGRPEAGLDSHFYSASPAECDAVLERFSSAWMLETSDLFDIGLPDPSAGACVAGTAPVYRLYNDRPDANHRYTADTQVRSSMIAAGWIPEGYGAGGVVMCSPI